MELSSPKPKNVTYFFPKNIFLIFLGMEISSFKAKK